jgi:hypothetical protein
MMRRDKRFQPSPMWYGCYDPEENTILWREDGSVAVFRTRREAQEYIDNVLEPDFEVQVRVVEWAVEPGLNQHQGSVCYSC